MSPIFGAPNSPATWQALQAAAATSAPLCAAAGAAGALLATLTEPTGLIRSTTAARRRGSGPRASSTEPVMRFAAMKMMTVNTTRAPRIMMNMRKKALSFCADTVVAPKEVLG